MLSIRENSDRESRKKVLSSDRNADNFKLGVKKNLYNKMSYEEKFKQTAIRRALQMEERENKPIWLKQSDRRGLIKMTDQRTT